MAETNTSGRENTGDANNQQPGQVIKPGQAEETTFKFSPDVPSGNPVAPNPLQEPGPDQVPPPEPEASSTPPPPSAGDGVSWTASEFIAHEKSAGWYTALLLATAIIIVIVYLLTRDKISAVVVLFCAFALAALAGRKPRQLQYKINSSGITIAEKHFEYGLFKSFAIVPEGAFSSIVLMPLKRFAPLTTIYYAPEDEEKIVNVLSSRLPLEPHKLDAVDSLMRRIRF